MAYDAGRGPWLTAMLGAMSDRPSSDAVLCRAPRLRTLPLPDGRSLLRHPRGATLLGGVAAADLERLLELVDGRRTLGDIRRELAAEYAPEGVDDVVAALLRAGALRLVTAQGTAAVGVWDGGSEAGAHLVSALDAAGLAARRVEVLPGEGAAALDLLVTLAGGARHADLLRQVRRAMVAGVPCLPALLEPDGARLGPLTVAGVPRLPCVACSELARHRSLRLEPAELLAAVGAAPTLTPAELGETVFAAVVAELVRLSAAALDATGDPPLLAEVLHLTPTGRPRHHAVTRQPGCPLCAAGLADGGLSRLAARAEEAAVAAGERPRVRRGVPDEPVSVGIVGGGTAGYLSALALRRRHPRLPITLIESPQVPVVGVGEATTPLMPQFLHADLGLDPEELFAAVAPTLKLGIHFDWGASGDGFDYPFGPLRLADAVAHDGGVATASLRCLLMAAGRVPAYRDGAGGELRQRLASAVAYHLDNAPFVAWLRRQAEAAGVRRLEATVAAVERTADGEGVAALVSDDGRRLCFDLYVDCTGFRSLLLGDAPGAEWVSFGRSLFTDRALTAVAPLDPAAPLPPYTRAATWDAGWAWTIPQRRELHHGYVYASSHLDDDAAAAELRRRLPAAGEPRRLRFRCGRRRRFVRGNVAALGNAYGFVEPLESTALHLLIRQIGLLLELFPWTPEDSGRLELANRRVAGWWDYLAWFLALHYRFNRRLDTGFWRACREQVDVSRWSELLDVFRRRGPLSADPSLPVLFDAPDPLWGAEGIDLLLLAQGVAPGPYRPSRSAGEHREWLAAARRLSARALEQRELLAAWDEEPELLESLARPFRAAGPAYLRAPQLSLKSRR